MTLLDEAMSDDSDRKLAIMRQENSRLKSQVKQLILEAEELRQTAAFVQDIAAAKPCPPKWLKPKRKSAGKPAIAVAMLSDLHLDEVVRPEEVYGLNAFDRTIATQRLQLWAEKVVDLTTNYLAGITYEGAVVALGGDMFSGTIHDELVETNDDTLFGSLLYWMEQIAAALKYVADVFGQVYVPVVAGNHGRLLRKPRAKLSARDNIDWLLGNLLAQYFKGDDRFTFDVPDSLDTSFDVYGVRHLMTHGDQVTGGSGIGGIWPSVKRLEARKRERESFDVIIMGHFHQLIQTTTLIVNGALKGFDEYAARCNFRPERAQQALWVVTPSHGISWHSAIHVDDRKSEGW